MARRENVRVGLLRGLGVMLIVGFALGTAVSAWVAIVLHGLTRDIQTSEASLPSQVRNVLPSSSNVLDQPQVTMVRYSSGVSKSAVVLFATVPDRRLAGFMTMPPSTSVGATTLIHLPTKDAIQALRRHGIKVTHVALISPAQVGPLVSSLGGVTIVNPMPFAVTAPTGATVQFPAGRMRLDGDRAALYVAAATTNDQLEQASSAVLTGIVHQILQPSDIGRLQTIGHSLASAVSTDLTGADVVGLVDLRLRGGTLLDCRTRRQTPITSPRSQAAVRQLLGASATGPCTSQAVAGQTTAPAVVVRAVQRYGWQLFGALTVALAALTAIAAALVAARWPGRQRPEPRPSSDPLPPLTWPPTG